MPIEWLTEEEDEVVTRAVVTENGLHSGLGRATDEKQADGTYLATFAWTLGSGL